MEGRPESLQQSMKIPGDWEDHLDSSNAPSSTRLAAAGTGLKQDRPAQVLPIQVPPSMSPMRARSSGQEQLREYLQKYAEPPSVIHEFRPT